MNCTETKDFQKTELFYMIDDIVHMENEGHRYKAMYVLWDVAQRLKRDELTTSMSQAEVLAGYGVVVEDGKSPIGETQILTHGQISYYSNSIENWRC